MKLNTKTKKYSFSIIAFVVVLTIALAYMAYAFTSKNVWPYNQETPTSSAESERDAIDQENYSPPTDYETDHSQDAKKAQQKTDENISEVTVVISYAGVSDDGKNVEINAFTPDVIESDGVCVATFTSNSGKTVTAQETAISDARSTICSMLVPVRNLAAGTWQLSVSYNSEGKIGLSNKVEIKI